MHERAGAPIPTARRLHTVSTQGERPSGTGPRLTAGAYAGRLVFVDCAADHLLR